jgi:hypothetical protein
MSNPGLGSGPGAEKEIVVLLSGRVNQWPMTGVEGLEQRSAAQKPFGLPAYVMHLAVWSTLQPDRERCPYDIGSLNLIRVDA